MFTPEAAAQWLATRLGRPISRQTIHLYVAARDLPALNIGGGDRRAHWIIQLVDLEAFADRITASGGKLPMPTGGWPQRAGTAKRAAEEARKKANGLAAYAI